MAHQLAPEARNDLNDIWDYVSKESNNPDTADRLIDSIVQRFYLLSQQPYAGCSRFELLAGMRSFPVGQYVILYRVEHPDVFIFRVIHGRRDIESALQQ
jgi:toxin ParE1/3/4